MEFDLKGRPTGAVSYINTFLPRQVGNLESRLEGIRAFTNGVMLIDTQKWREQKITEKCLDYLINNEKYNLFQTIQSVTSLVHMGNFTALSREWQVFPGNNVKLRNKTKDTSLYRT